MKKLKHRMVYMVALSAFVVFALSSAITYLLLNIYVSNRADAMTELIGSNDGVAPQFQDYRKIKKGPLDDYLYYDEESAFRARYFVIYFDKDENIKKTDVSHVAAVDKDIAEKMAKKAFEKGNTTGFIGDYRYRIVSASKDEDNLAVFLDFGNEIYAVKIATASVIIVSLVLTFSIILVFAILSNKVIRPFEENSKTQKQFITNASHELKTPLAVISANADVLAYKDGENAWIKNIKAQIERMSGLISELLTLSKMEEFDGELYTEEVNISNIIDEHINSFSEVFAKKEVKIISKIPPDITLNANTQQINMLISILIENASKYVSSPGTVELSLSTGMRYTAFKIFNTAEIPQDLDCKKLFDRFYRPDNSRTSSTGGHGLGLSIAHKIVIVHKGTINAKRKDNGIIFTAEISNNLKKKSQKKKKNQK